MKVTKTQENSTHNGAKRPTGDHKAARNRQDCITKVNLNYKKHPQKKRRLGKVTKNTGGLKNVEQYQPPFNSDVY